jgi:ssDNA-binding Zn-finger/Zn-ribbon topoisomerase 1
LKFSKYRRKTTNPKEERAEEKQTLNVVCPNCGEQFEIEQTSEEEDLLPCVEIR